MRFYTTFANSLLFILIFSLCPTKNNAQTGILLNEPEAMPSYTLYENMPMVYLVDNCGQLVNSWNTGYMSYHPKLLPNGNLIFISDRFTVREMDWDGNIVNEVEHEDLELSIEYEVILLPNQNYLCVARRDFSMEQFIDLGYNWTGFTSPNVTDGVVELDRETGDIVWEWNIRDHVIQEREPDANNFGAIADHPELLNMDAILTHDWNFHESFMINSMDYNPELDQIALSVRKLSEIVIIDHSTTTEQAAGHTGGNSGKGGDALYRWGNPFNYGRGEPTDRQLFFQHNPNWITEGVHAGKMTVYDNGLNRPDVTWEDRYSTVPVLDLPVDENGNYLLEEEAAYEPEFPYVRFSRIDTETDFYSSYTSGAEVLPNGNIFITEGVEGRLLELTPAGEIVWRYNVPFVSYIYRTEKYPLDYPGFEGQDLTPVGPAPNTNSTYECLLTTDTEELTQEETISANYFPAGDLVRLRNGAGHGMTWEIYNVQGQRVGVGSSSLDQHEITMRHLPKGLYVFQVQDAVNSIVTVKKVVKYGE